MNGSVYHIKGNNKFKKFVNQKDKDVVVLFYADFCAHSRRLAPTFKEVSGIFRPMKDSLVFGQIEVTKNDIEFKVREYPKVFLFKRNNKESPVEY